ncbi:ATP-binding protein [Isoptericola sp. NEAU-Y5]|uniref:ATP-binding protein n=1 Tax=Isoptericola luteus TaxID=2879484 RepID=A0ABS7ZKW7_9MICO|nr:ATP-binding protein [Isoptericola sp. NEAU-Y5]MCA5895162.1 ATP-binding protein [Isoptericola sp. NEAU-Y5]
MTAHLVLMCGPAGSGKSTHARRLEAAGWVRVSVDDLAFAEGFTAHPLPDDVAQRVAADLRERVAALLDEGRDVVVDSSFWSRASRDEYRRLGAERGVVAQVVFVSTPREVALARVAARTGAHAHDVLLAPDVAAAYYDGFQVPTPDEGPLEVVPGG